MICVEFDQKVELGRDLIVELLFHHRVAAQLVPTVHQGLDLADQLFLVRRHGTLLGYVQVFAKGGVEVGDFRLQGVARGGRGIGQLFFQDLDLDEVGLGSAGIVDGHQGAVERGHRHFARGVEHAIARRAQERDQRAHGDEGGENLRADGIAGQKHGRIMRPGSLKGLKSGCGPGTPARGKRYFTCTTSFILG